MAQDNIKFEQGEIPAKKKKSPVFYIVLIVAILAGAFFGVREYQYSQSHEETDDAQIAADISPVISKISGYIAEVKVKDNQFVKKGDTLVVLDNRDQTMALEQAEAALGTAQSNVASAQAGSEAAKTGIGN